MCPISFLDRPTCCNTTIIIINFNAVLLCLNPCFIWWRCWSRWVHAGAGTGKQRRRARARRKRGEEDGRGEREVWRGAADPPMKRIGLNGSFISCRQTRYPCWYCVVVMKRFFLSLLFNYTTMSPNWLICHRFNVHKTLMKSSLRLALHPPKNFWPKTSHQMFRYIHRVLNMDKNKNQLHSFRVDCETNLLNLIAS